MSPDNKRSDDYWMGVRDALRMVDSFLRWSKDNKGRAKPMEDFIHDGLVAAAKRCESCLHKELGVKFDSEAEEDLLEEPILEDSIEDDMINDDTDSLPDDFESTPPEIVLSPDGLDTTDEVEISIESEIEEQVESESAPPKLEDGSVSIESMASKEGSVEDDTHVDGGAREFSSDFELVEPDPLIIDSASDDLEEEFEEIESSEDSYVPEPPSEVKEEISISRPKYSWEESTKSISEEPSEDSSFSESESEFPEFPKPWSPMDEPSPDTLDEEEEIVEDEDESESASPPPPPPPPETEESEEERRRRARRLFFGG